MSDPLALNGSLIRVDPATGAGVSTNPHGTSTNANERRIVAHGFRNPFRLAIRPGTNDVWLGDVGTGGWEEINRIPSPTDGVLRNFGWPCYEGVPRMGGFDAADLNLCETLYATPGAVTAPLFPFQHDQPVVSGEACPTNSGSADLGARVQRSEQLVPGDVQRCAVLRGLRPPVHLGHARGRNRSPEPGEHPVVRADGDVPRGSRVRARRTAVLRGHRHRDDQADHVHGRQSTARGRGLGRPHERRDTAHRELQRLGLERP